MSALEALNHKWLQQHVIKTPLNPKIVMCLLKHKKLDDFQHLCMLVLCELLSLADHGYVIEAQQQFFAVNQSLSGEICFAEFHAAIKSGLPAEQVPSEAEIKRAYDTVDRDLSDDVTWSEWQVALAYN